jgi:hypothetical protein
MPQLLERLENDYQTSLGGHDGGVLVCDSPSVGTATGSSGKQRGKHGRGLLQEAPLQHAPRAGTQHMAQSDEGLALLPHVASQSGESDARDRPGGAMTAAPRVLVLLVVERYIPFPKDLYSLLGGLGFEVLGPVKNALDTVRLARDRRPSDPRWLHGRGVAR